MRRISFESLAFVQFKEWADDNPVIFERLARMIIETARTPFTGIGKPEPLKNELRGFWSRRISLEHRLVYAVTEESIIIASCKYHY